MTVLLITCILLVAAWLLRGLVRSLIRGPRDSVDGFARALGALDPDAQRAAQARRAADARDAAEARRPVRRRASDAAPR